MWLRGGVLEVAVGKGEAGVGHSPRRESSFWRVAAAALMAVV